ncbi:MAG: hypothetical protein K9M54_07835 [Kiritimatiellales bacterium]|nr:hypothetical protein [Kiritimatiellales bacterium]MCF7863533.1 hypothetical protein [Kiritimatiellales bacterium]
MKRMGLMLVWGIALVAGAGPAFVDDALGWIFPQELGGLAYTMAEKYDDPSLGYCVFYRSSTNFAAEVSVYTLGRDSIPDGCKGEGVDMVLQSAEGALALRQKQEQISGLKKRGTAVVPRQGDIQFASAVFQYLEGATNGVQKITSAYATGFRNTFIKLEFTFDLVDGAAARPMADQMVAQLIGMAKARPDEQALLMASCAALLHDPDGYGGRTAAQRVMAKAQTMETLNIYTHLFVWPDGYRKPKNADLLVAAYFAGMLQVVVPQQLETGGEFEGFLGMLQAYGAMRAKDQIDAIPEYDEWAKAPDKKALFNQLLVVQ